MNNCNDTITQWDDVEIADSAVVYEPQHMGTNSGIRDALDVTWMDTF